MPFLAPAVPWAIGAIGGKKVLDSATEEDSPDGAAAAANDAKNHQEESFGGGGLNGAANEVNRYKQMGADGNARQGTTIDTQQSNWDRIQAGNARNEQTDALSLQRDAAMGYAPSAAQMQQTQGINDAINAQQSSAASARGGPLAAAAAQRQAQFGGSQMMQQGVANNAILRAQEMAQARGAYQAGATGIRGQDYQAQGLAQQGAQAQAGLYDAQAARNQQNQLFFEGQGADAMNSQLNANIQRRGQDEGHWGAQSGLDQNAKDRTQKYIMGGISAAGQVGGALASDERVKHDVQPLAYGGRNEYSGALPLDAGADETLTVDNAGRGALAKFSYAQPGEKSGSKVPAASLSGPSGLQYMSAKEKAPAAQAAKPKERRLSNDELARQADAMMAQIQEQTRNVEREAPAAQYRAQTAPQQMLNAVEPYAFKYKDGTGLDSTKQRYGVMAQDLEKSPMGKSLVNDTPGGKVIDVPMATGATLAGLADVQDQINELRARRGR